MLSRNFLLSAVLLVGGATATTFYETLYYNDADCEDLNSTEIIDGIYGKIRRNLFTPARWRQQSLPCCQQGLLPYPYPILKLLYVIVAYPEFVQGRYGLEEVSCMYDTLG